MSQKDDDLTVSKIYGVLKSPSFLQKLYWDTLSVVKRGETYKEVRSLAEQLIDQKMEALETLSDSESDNVRRKTTVAEISSMCYAIDTVYSKILFIKLVKAVKSLIPGIVTELRNERKIPDDVWHAISESRKPSDDELVSETQNEPSTSSGIRKRKIISTSVEKEKKEVTKENGEASDINETRKEPFTLSGVRKRKIISTSIEKEKKEVTKENEEASDINEMPNELSTSSGMKKQTVISINGETSGIICKDITQNDVPVRKRGRPRKKLGGRIQALPKRNLPEPATSTPKQILSEEKELALPGVFKITETNHVGKVKDSTEINNQESDAESISSEGNASMVSVSSVHTSDLSSFDDEISLSSDDEGGNKKRFSIKDLQEKFSRSEKLSSTSPEKSSNSEENKSLVKVSAAENVGNSAKSVTTNQSPEILGTSKRIRKPNSKYSSYSVHSIKVKERRKSNELSRINTEKILSKELSPKTKKIKTSNENIEFSSVTQKVDIPSNHTTSLNNATKQSDSLYKSQTTLPSLTSRRTAPVTLFSTGT